MPVLLVGSGQDRLLPSLSEQTRLQRLLPNAQRLVLPDSGHTALLEAIPLHLLHCIVAVCLLAAGQLKEVSSTCCIIILHAMLVPTPVPACSWQTGQHKANSVDCTFYFTLTWGLHALLLDA